jgi:hypothetical protein
MVDSRDLTSKIIPLSLNRFALWDGKSRPQSRPLTRFPCYSLTKSLCENPEKPLENKDLRPLLAQALRAGALTGALRGLTSCGLEFPTKSEHGVKLYSVCSYSAGATYPNDECRRRVL